VVDGTFLKAKAGQQVPAARAEDPATRHGWRGDNPDVAQCAASSRPGYSLEQGCRWLRRRCEWLCIWWGLGRCPPSDVVGWSSVKAQERLTRVKSQGSRVSCIHVPSASTVFVSNSPSVFTTSAHTPRQQLTRCALSSARPGYKSHHSHASRLNTHPKGYTFATT
jgi:hypothetical protein